MTSCGRICMHRKNVDVSTVISGQRLGLKEGDDAIWLVLLMDGVVGQPKRSCIADSISTTIW